MAKFFVALSLLFLVALSESQRTPDQDLGEEVTQILDSLTRNYDKRIRPNYGGEPVNVGVTMFILSISSVSEANMEFTADFYFRQTWVDPRLRFKGPQGINVINTGSEFAKTLWTPDTFFVNEQKSYFHTATKSNELLRISENGDVLRSIRLTVTASCPMDLRHFPMDSQLCSLEIESFGSSMKDIRYKWAKGLQSVGVASDVSLPHFKVLGHRQQSMEIFLTTGNYSRLSVDIQFVRSTGYYLTQIYFPAGFLVIMSWVVFWVNRDKISARIVIGVSTVLTLAILFSYTNASLPKISYVKASDVYLVFCLIMAFLALLETATVGYVTKRFKMWKTDESNLEAEKNTDEDQECHEQPEVTSKPEGRTNKNLSLIRKILSFRSSIFDLISRVLFPLIFIIFNITYWNVYLKKSDVWLANEMIPLMH